jgi:hypothetical protein
MKTWDANEKMGSRDEGDIAQTVRKAPQPIWGYPTGKVGPFPINPEPSRPKGNTPVRRASQVQRMAVPEWSAPW